MKHRSINFNNELQAISVMGMTLISDGKEFG